MTLKPGIMEILSKNFLELHIFIYMTIKLHKNFHNNIWLLIIYEIIKKIIQNFFSNSTWTLNTCSSCSQNLLFKHDLVVNCECQFWNTMTINVEKLL
jgi:hypothetical protein